MGYTTFTSTREIEIDGHTFLPAPLNIREGFDGVDDGVCFLLHIGDDLPDELVPSFRKIDGQLSPQAPRRILTVHQHTNSLSISREKSFKEVCDRLAASEGGLGDSPKQLELKKIAKEYSNWDRAMRQKKIKRLRQLLYLSAVEQWNKAGHPAPGPDMELSKSFEREVAGGTVDFDEYELKAKYGADWDLHRDEAS